MTEFLTEQLENEYMIESVHQDQWVLCISDQGREERRLCDG